MHHALPQCAGSRGVARAETGLAQAQDTFGGRVRGHLLAGAVEVMNAGMERLANTTQAKRKSTHERRLSS